MTPATTRPPQYDAIVAAPDTSPEHFIRSRQYAPATRYLYKLRIGEFGEWCEQRGIAREGAGPSDVRTYLDERRATGSKDSTVDSIFTALKSYFGWLEEIGAIDRSPTRHMRPGKRVWTPAPAVSIDELRNMLSATPSTKNWIIIALLGIYALMPKEIMAITIDDFDDSGEYARLRIVPHSTNNRIPSILLPDIIADRIRELIEGRRSGPLFVNDSNGNPINRSNITYIVESAARRAGITDKVGPKHLQYALPTAALDHGFSYVSVIRSMGIIQPRHSARWLHTGQRPDEENASLRLARMVVHPPEASENWLVHAEALLRETDIPEVVTVMMSGAIVERHLRLLSLQHGISPAKDETRGNIKYYVGELQREGVVTIPDAREFRALSDKRNDAAHGWFERLPQGSGVTALRDAQELIGRYPLADPGD